MTKKDEKTKSALVKPKSGPSEAVKRDSGGRFVKGQCGNPGGKSLIKRRLEDEIRAVLEGADGNRFVKKLEELAFEHKDWRCNTVALKMLGDWGYGTPGRRSELKDESEEEGIITLKLVDTKIKAEDQGPIEEAVYAEDEDKEDD